MKITQNCCHHCGRYFNIEHVDEKGFWFRPEKEENK